MQTQVEKRWLISENENPIPMEVEAALGQYPFVLRRLLHNRGITTAEEAERYLNWEGALYDPWMLDDMEAVVERLLLAVDRGEQIVVYGDYDVDGVTATVMMVQVLRRLGGQVREYIPNRFEEGYGLNCEALEGLAAEGAQVVVTVDCGIRSPAEAHLARKLGVDLIISDHHEPHEEVPAAFGVISPKRPDNRYPDTNLAGVGVAYKIVEALLTRRPLEGCAAEDWLDLVAVGTVADIVPLVGENRSLVKAGLRRMRQGPRRGLASLAGAAEIQLNKITARDIGYGLGPRLNAAGRLESALASFHLLDEEDGEQASVMAQHLDDQNRQRQDLTLFMQRVAEEQMAERPAAHLVFAASPEFNMGVVGLVASRLTELYYRPSVVGARGEEFTRASCRSIPEFHITQALDECADLLVRHGGHSMAAGLTVRNEDVDALVSRLQEIAHRELDGRELKPVVRADLALELRDLRPELLPLMDQIEPTGMANHGVYFVTRGLQVRHFKTVGREQQHLRLTVGDGHGLVYDAIGFRLGHWARQMPERVDLLYAFEKNVYMGRESLQLNVRDLKPAD